MCQFFWTTLYIRLHVWINVLYTSLFATRSHSTYYKNRNRKKIIVTYKATISREKTKAQHLCNIIYSKYSVVNLESKTRLYYSFNNIAFLCWISVTQAQQFVLLFIYFILLTIIQWPSTSHCMMHICFFLTTFCIGLLSPVLW